jgi:hypothetical protein
MKSDDTQLNCQIPGLQGMSEGRAAVPPYSLMERLKLMIRRRLSPSRERKVKSFTNDLMNRFCRLTGRNPKPNAPQTNAFPAGLQAGDWVRVRPLNDIEATLNHWRQLKGCAFIPEMAKYCGTSQRVFRTVKRFMDERDLRIKKSSGIVLLDGVFCGLTTAPGECDRYCFLFWREEWLEKIDPLYRASIE